MQWFLDNLLPEIIGIVLTVFLVDKLIQRREDARWLPSKYFLYSRLISHFDEVMWATIPFLMSGTKYIYEFGNAVATTLDTGMDLSIPETNKKVWLEIRDYSKKITLENKIEILQKLSDEKDEIDNILASSISLIEPELSSILMKLQGELGNAKNMIAILPIDEKLPPFEFAQNADLFSLCIYNATVSAHEAKNWVVRKATNKRTTDEFAQELRKMTQQQGLRSNNG